jgi:PPOX class probable F420-dependent enzyme
VLDPSRPTLYTPLDEKPKNVSDVHELARVRDIAADRRVTVLIDRWDEDWAQLAWVRMAGSALLMEPGSNEHLAIVRALREKYEQYRAHDLETCPIIAIAIERVTSWGRLVG